MNWNEISSLRAWMPLSEINSELSGVKGVVRVGPDAYLRIQEYNRNFEVDDPGAPFVTMGYWASSCDALQRTVAGDPSIGFDLPIVLPPKELLNETSGSYSELLTEGVSRGAKILERAIYSNEGLFLYRLLDIDEFTYHFLGNDCRGEDFPSLIAIKLA